MISIIARRVVLRFNERYELQEGAIIEKFSALYGRISGDDFYSHSCPANISSNVYVVLDIHCKTVPNIYLQMIPYQVFKVRKNEELFVRRRLQLALTDTHVSHFEELLHGAPSLARLRCQDLRWGRDQSHPEELDGDRPTQMVHSPGTFVS